MLKVYIKKIVEKKAAVVMGIINCVRFKAIVS